jgi:hypothetical protein
MPDGKKKPRVKGGTKAKKKSKSTKASKKYKKAELEAFKNDEKAKQEAFNKALSMAPRVETWKRDGETFKGPHPNDQFRRIDKLNNLGLGLSDKDKEALLSTPQYQGTTMGHDPPLGGGSRKSRKSNRRRKTKLNRRKSRRIR